LIAQTVKRLSMFVMRAKAKLSDATDEFQLLGLAADAVGQADTAHVLPLYPALGQPRALWLAPKDAAIPTGAALRPELWQVGEVMSGIAWVELATFEAFVPQMLNYESVEGVNFKKGCYPGQEIVARSQFRGTLKRRAFIVQSNVPMTSGQEVFSSVDATQPCGLIAQAAQDGAVCVAIAELQLSATENSSLHLGTSDGAVLQLLPLPYALRDDI
jgi:folate-binding protein YgfZ